MSLRFHEMIFLIVLKTNRRPAKVRNIGKEWGASVDFKKFTTRFLSDKSCFLKNYQKQFPIKTFTV